MSDNEYEVHPLDRDYSEEVQPPFATKVDFDRQLRRVGIIVFAIGFAVLFLAAVVLGTFRGSGAIESIGSTVHRLAMVVILIGGGLVVLAYRLPSLKKLRDHARARPTIKETQSTFWALVGWNAGALVMVVAANFLLAALRSSLLGFLIFDVAFRLAIALFVTISIWHRGMLRAYAIGVLVALLLNNGISVATLFSITSSFGNRNIGLQLILNVALAMISGLVCAAYVRRLELSGFREADLEEIDSLK